MAGHRTRRKRKKRKWEILTGFLPKFFVKDPSYVDGLNAHMSTNFSLTGIVSINEYNVEKAA